MTLFPIILSSLRLPEEIWRRRKLKWSEKAKIALYLWVLRRGLKAYRRYAIYDEISLDEGRVRIIHEYRDHAFEKELKTAKVISQLSFKTSSFPFKTPASMRGFRHRWFDFTDVLQISVDGRELKVEHGEWYKASSKGKLPVKRTGEHDYIIAALYTLNGSQIARRTSVKTAAPASAPTAIPTPLPAKKPAGKSGKSDRSAGKGMFGNTAGPGLKLPQPGALAQDLEVKPRPEPVPVQVMEPERESVTVIRKRGLDIDTSF